MLIKTRTALQTKQNKETELKPKQTTYIDPFIDFAFKRLFSSEESKPVLIGLLNHLFKGDKFITAIEYGKNEHHGEIAEDGGVVFDVYCTDADGSHYIIEIQRGYQKNFKERAVYYASKAINDQAPKGGRKDWAYDLNEVHLVAFLEDFNLPEGSKSEYLQNICLANSHTGKIFYDKLSLIFIEMINFVKGPEQLETDIDRWLYALKHLKEFKTRPAYLSGPEFDQLFNLAQYANLTKKEKAMYDASLKYKWDNKNVRDYEVSKGREEGREEGLHKKALEIAKEMLAEGEPLERIVKYTKLSIEEIRALD